MFELDIEAIKEQGLQLVDTAKKTALGLADKGKNQLDLFNQQARLSKAQRQLGALVYNLHKSGEEEQAIADIKVKMTPAEVAEAEKETEAEAEAEAAEPAAEEPVEEEPIAPRGETKTCPVCQAEIDADALFCNHCGAQL